MSNDASTPQEEQRVSPEYLPLPTLPATIEYDLAIVITDARVQLYDELNLIWASSFPEQIPTDRSGNLLVRTDPAKFFPPFIAYGVKYYDAYAHALLRLKPRSSDYSAWVNFALRALVCDELVPYRPVGERDQRLSQWQLHMGLTWRLFDHPNHSALFPMAQRLIDLLEDVMDPYWDTFQGTLHTAISRRTLPLLAEGLKELRQVTPTPAAGPSAGSGSKGQDWQAQNWADVEICFVSDQRVQITVGAHTETLNYAEFGFVDGRSGTPSLAWLTLRVLAEARGTLYREQNGREGTRVEKRMQAIRATLRNYFKLDGDPLPLIKGIGYQTQFRISCAPAYNS